MGKPEVIKIDDVEHVRIDFQKYVQLDGMDYVIIRSYDAGCFAGYLQGQTEDNKSVTMLKVRRLWYWDGAASLSQLAMEGVNKPENCKFPCEVDEITVNNVCEIIKTTEKAKESIKEVPVWKK